MVMPVAPQAPAAPPNVAISFSAEIIPQTMEALLRVCAELANNGVQTVYLLISTPGGSVMNGLNAYNILRAMPFQLITHNVGNVDSIGNVVFLAGEQRYACPNTTFMFHGVGAPVQRDERLVERTLQERLDSLQADQRRIAEVISQRSRLTIDNVEAMFLEAKTKDPAWANEVGIIDEIRDVQLPPGTPVHQLVFQR